VDRATVIALVGLFLSAISTIFTVLAYFRRPEAWEKRVTFNPSHPTEADLEVMLGIVRDRH
jgi:hypothetical protein